MSRAALTFVKARISVGDNRWSRLAGSGVWALNCCRASRAEPSSQIRDSRTPSHEPNHLQHLPAPADARRLRAPRGAAGRTRPQWPASCARRACRATTPTGWCGSRCTPATCGRAGPGRRPSLNCCAESAGSAHLDAGFALGPLACVRAFEIAAGEGAGQPGAAA